MRFWDSSALVPLIAAEPASAACADLLRADGVVAVWALTRLEIVSALRRKRRAGELTLEAIDDAMRRVGAFEEAWVEVDGLATVRVRAERLLGVHALRAADAMQLAAALVLFEERPTGEGFVTRDARLADAARAEGFAVSEPG